jgi:hypothetical protein
MAKLLGKAGTYASQVDASKRRRKLLVGFCVIGLLGIVEGLCLSTLWSFFQPSRGLSTIMLCLAAGAALGIAAWADRKLDKLEAERLKWQRGAEGETAVGKIIGEFPDDFYVINDLSTPYGNLDHVVVGPTGVFVLDAKNWRGVVQADGKGELLLNTKPTDKAYIRNFVGRFMGVKEKVRALTNGADPYFQGLFVFTAARVEAAWGKTGWVNCLREDQLQHYIVEKEFGKRLPPSVVERLAQAFLSLAQMDRDFAEGVMQENAQQTAAPEIGHKRDPVNLPAHNQHAPVAMAVQKRGAR